jgi:threonine/homoserine/homoserine lactone efflux protein
MGAGPFRYKPMNHLIIIFSLALIVALSGAMVPGPLFTYTIIKTLNTKRRGFLVGAWVIGGHALLETAIIVCILLGFSTFLKNKLIIRIIAVLGAGFLLYMGITIIKDVVQNRIPKMLNAESRFEREGSSRRRFQLSNPVLGGILVSMSNPYWWIWWATVGFGFMLKYQISFRNWPALVSFLIGHEMGDLLWYLLISTLVFMGRHRINEKTYRIILLFCSVVIIGFGIFLGTSSFLQ